MGIHDYTIYDYIRYNASTAGFAHAAISENARVTHQEFLEWVDRLAAGLNERGVVKGDRICILAQNSIRYLELYGACAKTGAIAFPINWRLSAVEVKEVVRLADPKMLVVGVGHLPQLEACNMSGIELRALIGPGTADGFASLDAFYQDSKDEQFDVSSDDPLVIISTAAVAGVPRGAVLTHSNLVMAGFQLIQALGLCQQDRNLAALPFFHISGLGLALSMIQAGGANVVLEKLDPARAVKLMDEHAVTIMADFPPILSMLLDARAAAGAQWDHLKHVIGLDAPDVIRRLYAETQAKFWTGFGQSETSGVGTLVRADTKPGTAGRPLPLIRMRCVDENGRETPVGVPGEIVMQGPVIFSGYWRDPDASRFTFRHNWHHTGDIGKFDLEGYLYYVGRMPEKDLIKSGGENVYPAEVELAILDLPEVEAVCVIGIQDEKWGEAVKAVVELAPGKALTAEQVISAVAERIASYKKPHDVEFVARLPLTPDGGIDRAAVKAAYTKL